MTDGLSGLWVCRARALLLPRAFMALYDYTCASKSRHSALDAESREIAGVTPDLQGPQ